MLTHAQATQFLADQAPIRASRGMNEDQGTTRATRLLLWLLSMRPDVATVEAAPAEPTQAYLEQCFRQVSAGR